jgi:8-oxo-dGTP diphosphatase
MDCFEATITEGTPKLLEHNDARWLTKDQLDEVNWIPADLTIIDYLKETME